MNEQSQYHTTEENVNFVSFNICIAQLVRTTMELIRTECERLMWIKPLTRIQCALKAQCRGPEGWCPCPLSRIRNGICHLSLEKMSGPLSLVFTCYPDTHEPLFNICNSLWSVYCNIFSYNTEHLNSCT